MDDNEDKDDDYVNMLVIIMTLLIYLQSIAL